MKEIWKLGKIKLNLVFTKDKIHLKILNVWSRGHAHYVVFYESCLY